MAEGDNIPDVVAPYFFLVVDLQSFISQGLYPEILVLKIDGAVMVPKHPRKGEERRIRLVTFSDAGLEHSTAIGIKDRDIIFFAVGQTGIKDIDISVTA